MSADPAHYQRTAFDIKQEYRGHGVTNQMLMERGYTIHILKDGDVFAVQGRGVLIA